MASREGRRRTSRAPGIWRGTAAKRTEHAPHGVQGRSLPSARLVSGLIVLSLLGVLLLFFSAGAFYVQDIRSIAVGGLEYLTVQEVFELSQVDDVHIFWIDPAQVRESILRSSTVADVDVEVGWPPEMLRISVQERQPALVWEQAGVPTWIDLRGRVMVLREERPDLMRIVADNAVEGPLGPNVQLDPDIVGGALQLHSLFPDLQLLRYHPEYGLGYADSHGWEAWFGTGTDMPNKAVVYEALVKNLLSRNIQVSAINVANTHAPFYLGRS